MILPLFCKHGLLYDLKILILIINPIQVNLNLYKGCLFNNLPLTEN